MKLFRRQEDGGFVPIKLRDYGREHLEEALEEQIAANPTLLGSDLLLIGRQVRTKHGIIDLMALDSSGRVHVIELKRGRSSRRVVGQLNSYLTIVKGWSEEELAKHARLVTKSGIANDLIATFKQHFALSIAPSLNRRQVGMVVAESFDSDLTGHLGGLRFECRALQYSYFVGESRDEYWLMRVVHDTAKPVVKRRRPASTLSRAVTPEEQETMDRVAQWVSRVAGDIGFLTSSQIATASLDAKKLTRKTAITITKVMRKLGWRASAKRVNGRVIWGFHRADPENDLSVLGDLV